MFCCLVRRAAAGLFLPCGYSAAVLLDADVPFGEAG
jgi:hypothetical protein